MAVTQPIRYAKQKGSRRAYLALIPLTWVVSVAVSSPIALGMNYSASGATNPRLEAGMCSRQTHSRPRPRPGLSGTVDRIRVRVMVKFHTVLGSEFDYCLIIIVILRRLFRLSMNLR